jgi:hypothetical protein
VAKREAPSPGLALMFIPGAGHALSFGDLQGFDRERLRVVLL